MDDMQKRNREDMILQLKNIHAWYYDYEALKGICLNIRRGEICAITGENGAGKTTLMHVIAGMRAVKEGELFFDGTAVVLNDARSASELGIWLVEQEPQLVDSLTIEQTLFLGHEEIFGWKCFSIIRKKKHMERIREILEYMNWNVNPYIQVAALGNYERKLMYIARALLFDVRVILLDDSMAGFSSDEKENFIRLIRKINRSGISVIFISINVIDIIELADHVVILNEGSIIFDEHISAKTDINLMIRALAGDYMRNRYPRIYNRPGAMLYETRNLTMRDKSLNQVNMSFHEGEIVGIVVENEASRRSLLDCLIGMQMPDEGELIWMHKTKKFKSIDEAIRSGISFLSDDNVYNIYRDKTVEFNVSLPNLDEIQSGLYLEPQDVREFTLRYLNKIQQKNVQCADPANSFSYGVQRKISFARVLCAGKKFHIMVEPTSGLDNVSKIEIYNILNSLANSGKGIVLISLDIDEIVGMCDRIYVILEGCVVREFSHNYATNANILLTSMAKGHQSSKD